MAQSTLSRLGFLVGPEPLLQHTSATRSRQVLIPEIVAVHQLNLQCYTVAINIIFFAAKFSSNRFFIARLVPHYPNELLDYDMLFRSHCILEQSQNFGSAK